MCFKLISAIVLLSIVSAQTTSATAQAAAPIVRTEPAPAPTGSLVIPAGTVIPLTLVSSIRTRSTKPGDLVRAQVAFPITVGTSLVIPAGTFVEGVMQAVAAKKTKTNPGGLEIHFTRLIYANGYKVSLDAVNTQSQVTTPTLSDPGFLGVGVGLGLGGDSPVRMVPHIVSLSPMIGQAPTPPPLPPLPGPPKAFLVALAIGGAIAIAGIILFIVHAHHYSNADMVAFDSGWQFQMVLTIPVTVDAGQVNAATAIAPQ